MDAQKEEHDSFSDSALQRVSLFGRAENLPVVPVLISVNFEYLSQIHLVTAHFSGFAFWSRNIFIYFTRLYFNLQPTAGPTTNEE
jgi:hypothetical protein